jgi:recombination protein RecA
MAKDKKESLDDFQKQLQSDIAELNKLPEFKGSELTLFAGEVQDIPRISSGIPDLDKAMGGGLPRGRVVEFFGQEAGGKTWLLLKTYASAQKNKLKCIHFDVEQSLNMQFAEMNGVDMSQLGFYQPGPEDHAENLLEKIVAICRSGKFDIVGIDSIAAFIPKEELEGSIEDQQMGLLARVMSKALRKITNAAAQGDTLVIFINQIRTKLGTYGSPLETPGGKALKFYASIRIDANKKYTTKADCPEIYEGDKMVGHILRCKVIKNKTAPPFEEAEVVLLYRPRRTVIQLMVDGVEKGILDRNKTNGKRFKFNGQDILIQEKGNWEQLLEVMRSSNLLMDFLGKMGANQDDLNKIIRDGDLTEDMVLEYTKNKKKSEKITEKTA